MFFFTQTQLADSYTLNYTARVCVLVFFIQDCWNFINKCLGFLYKYVMYPVLFWIFIPRYVLTYFTLPALGLYLATVITCHHCEGKGLGVCFSKIKRNPQTASLNNFISLNPTEGPFWCPGVLHRLFQPTLVYLNHPRSHMSQIPAILKTVRNVIRMYFALWESWGPKSFVDFTDFSIMCLF